MGTSFSSLKVAGAKANFYQGMDSVPTHFQEFCTVLPATTKVENFPFPGMLPIPVVMQGSRQFQNMHDFNLRVENETYELSTVIPREALEDDQTSTINRRLQDLGAAWATFKDQLFATLISDGDVSGNNAFDGTLFFTGTRVIGKSANIDNTETAAAAVGTVPTASELLDVLDDVLPSMMGYQDDQGRAGFAMGAMRKKLIYGPPTYERAFVEALNSTLISNSDNPWGRNLFDYVVSPYAIEADEMVVALVGGNVKPFVYSERTTVEIEILSDAGSIAENDGLMVLSRQRFILAYGDPRFALLFTWS